MDEDLTPAQKEQLSALIDGELTQQEMASALAFAVTDSGVQSWQLYQMVGDVLRAGEYARNSQLDVLAAVRAGIAKPAAIQEQPALWQQLGYRRSAANSAVFRWQLIAGLASVAAVSALTWSLLQGSGPQPDVQFAQSLELSPLQSATTASEVILRDPRLDELLANQRQYSSAAAWQIPAHFLRNANFSGSSVLSRK